MLGMGPEGSVSLAPDLKSALSPRMLDILNRGAWIHRSNNSCIKTALRLAQLGLAVTLSEQGDR
jgi:hypothetical protein